jgi:integrase
MLKDKSRYKHDLKQHFGKMKPSELAHLDVDRIRLRLMKTQAPATVKNILELLRRIVNYGVKRNLIEPLKFKIELPTANNLTTDDLTPEQLALLLKVLNEAIDQAAANIMRLALYTGMRRGELLGLSWDAVDFERGFIAIRDPTKGGTDQTIPLNAAARAILENHPRIPGSNFVFPGKRKGKHATEMRKSISRIALAAGLPEGFRPMHGLRHIFASMLGRRGHVHRAKVVDPQKPDDDPALRTPAG